MPQRTDFKYCSYLTPRDLDVRVLFAFSLPYNSSAEMFVYSSQNLVEQLYSMCLHYLLSKVKCDDHSSVIYLPKLMRLCQRDILTWKNDSFNSRRQGEDSTPRQHSTATTYTGSDVSSLGDSAGPRPHSLSPPRRSRNPNSIRREPSLTPSLEESEWAASSNSAGDISDGIQHPQSALWDEALSKVRLPPPPHLFFCSYHAFSQVEVRMTHSRSRLMLGGTRP
jgi:hypothetical protein